MSTKFAVLIYNPNDVVTSATLFDTAEQAEIFACENMIDLNTYPEYEWNYTLHEVSAEAEALIAEAQYLESLADKAEDPASRITILESVQSRYLAIADFDEYGYRYIDAYCGDGYYDDSLDDHRKEYLESLAD